MTQFPSTSTSLQFDPRSTTGEVNASRRDNQSNSGSTEDSRFSRALDDSSSRSDTRSDVRRDDAQTSARDHSPRDNDLRTDRTENAAPENAVDQSADPELSNDETETGSLEATAANEQDTTNQSEAILFDPFSLFQQLTNETAPAGTDAVATEGSLLASTAIAGFLPNGEGIGGVVTAQQNLTTAALQGTSNPLQAGLLNQNLAAQTNIALSQLNGNAGNAVGDVFENVLTTQLSNAGVQTTATSAQALLSNLQPNVQPNSGASILQASQLGELNQQTANANAGLNLTNTEGEQFGALLNSNKQTASPSQQLASLLSSTSSADVALPSPAQLTNPQLQQVVQQPVQQASQPLAQFANAAFANDTVPAFTAQISRNFAAGQDAFNVRLNPSELGRVDVRVINNDDGTVSTQIRVERSETLDLFQRDIRALERSLQQSGIKLGSEGIDLSLKDNGAEQGGNNQVFDNEFDAQGENAQNSDPALEVEEANQYLDNDGLLVDDLTADIALDQVQTIYARYQPGQLNIRV